MRAALLLAAIGTGALLATGCATDPRPDPSLLRTEADNFRAAFPEPRTGRSKRSGVPFPATAPCSTPSAWNAEPKPRRPPASPRRIR